MAGVTGHTFFLGLVRTRHWNASLGGVYAPVSDKVKPNPYLEDPKRDLVSADGMKLTKINPAFMTRMVSEVSQRFKEASFRITSLKPLAPTNKATPREAKALRAFESGASSMSVVIQKDDGPQFWYMAPLVTEKVCLKCHGKQGYKEGDIRGGIAVSFSYAPFARAAEADLRRVLLWHLAFAVLGVAILIMLGVPLLAAVRRAGKADRRVDALEELLPICSSCKRIRRQGGDFRDQDAWVAVDKYFKEHRGADFTHSICPECKEKLIDGQD